MSIIYSSTPKYSVNYVAAAIACAQESKVTHKVFGFLRDSFELASHWTTGVWSSAFESAKGSLSAAGNTLILTKIPGTALGFFRACWNLPNADEDLGAEMSSFEKMVHTGTDLFSDSINTVGWFKTAFQGASLASKNYWGTAATCLHNAIEMKESAFVIYETTIGLSFRGQSLGMRELTDLVELRNYHMIKMAKNVLHVALVVLKLYFFSGFYALLVFHSASYCFMAMVEPFYKSIMTKTLDEKAQIQAKMA